MGIKLFARKKAADVPKPGAPPAVDVSRKDKSQRNGRRSGRLLRTRDEPPFVPANREKLDPDPLKRMYQQGRLAVILGEADKWRSHEHADHLIEKSRAELEQSFALVPAGNVTIPTTLTGQAGAREEDLDVEPFLLGICTITNAQFQHFVDAGAYDNLELWPEDMWPHLIEFKDQTDHPGPRFWREGRHDARLADHPVTGVSWYEAMAFAKWVGLRLPTEPEWQMAASWHINSTADLLRRFPWGDAMDNVRCNIWSSRISATVPVNSYPNGAAPNRVLQLIGNVWEWTGTEYSISDDEGRQIIAEMPMQVIRGGAYDTYFETQATSQFRTGQISFARSHNIGFRCALDLSRAGWLDED